MSGVKGDNNKSVHSDLQAQAGEVDIDVKEPNDNKSRDEGLPVLLAVGVAGAAESGPTEESSSVMEMNIVTRVFA